MAKEKKIPHVPDPTWTFTEVVPTIFALTFLAVLVAGACILMANKLRGDVRAANAQERMAAALERAYPAPSEYTTATGSITVRPGRAMDPNCSNPDQIRSSAADLSCALFGKENPCPDGFHPEDDGIGISCFTTKKNSATLPKPSLSNPHTAPINKKITKHPDGSTTYYDGCNTTECNSAGACTSTLVSCLNQSSTKFQLPTLGGTTKDMYLELNNVSVSRRTVQ